MPETLEGSAREALRKTGLHYTQQRERVWDVMRSRMTHLDAYDVYEEVRRNGGSMSLSTVYRILQVFRDHGLISENHLGEDHHHYEAVLGDVESDHHHAVCSNCGTVIEFTLSAESLLESEEALGGFVVGSIELSVSGVCRECNEKEAGGAG